LRLIRVRGRLIFATILCFILPVVLLFYLFSRPITPWESAWQIGTGKDKLTRFEFLSWFDQDARLYALTTPNEVGLAPSSPFYVFPWSPPRKREGKYIFKLNINTLSIQPILYEEFLTLNPQIPGKLPHRFQEFIQQQLDYEVAKKAPRPKMVVEAISFSTLNKRYTAKLSVSDFNRLQRRRFGTEFVNNEPRGWHTNVYYSGTIEWEIFEASELTKPIIVLKKDFKDWDYPLRRNDKKLIQPSFIGAFCKLYFLPDSRPAFMIFSKVYRGVYQVRQGIDDAEFSVIIP
jgi:hypothetical protein